MDQKLIDRLWRKAGGDHQRFATLEAEQCAELALSDPSDATWLGRAAREAVVTRIAAAFGIELS